MKTITKWDDLLRRGVSAAEAAVEMGCSRRTASAELRSALRRQSDQSFRYRHAQQVAVRQGMPGGDQSTWPIALQQLAQRIVMDGPQSVTDNERAAVIAALPRGIAVRR